MNAAPVGKWNAVVGPHDAVHVLCDVAVGRREESMPFIGRLAGHKILYPGNHDRCWYGHGASARESAVRSFSSLMGTLLEDVGTTLSVKPSSPAH